MVLLSLLLRLFRGRASALFIGLGLFAIFGCVCGPSVPQPDSCNMPSTGGVETLELGPGGEGSFRTFDAGEQLSLVRGGQGASMVTLRLRIGPKAPQCIGESVTIYSAFDHQTSLASLDVPVVTYDDPGGKRVTRTMYLIASSFNFAPRVQIVATVGQTKTEQTFAVDTRNGCGAIVACEQSCLFDCDQCGNGASSGALTARDQVNACVATFCPNGGADGGSDGGTSDAGTACRDSALQDPGSCKTAWDTCQSTQ